MMSDATCSVCISWFAAFRSAAQLPVHCPTIAKLMEPHSGSFDTSNTGFRRSPVVEERQFEAGRGEDPTGQFPCHLLMTPRHL